MIICFMKHLYIIGNGFDIHHCIPSRYKDFQKWLLENDEDIYYTVNEIIGDNEPTWWNEFETNLGNPFGVKQYTENVAFENQPDYGSDDYRDRDLYVAEYEVERDLGSLITSLKNNFQKWASELPEGDGLYSLKIETKESIFMTFNYTLTLEKLYGIPTDRILHIHGSALDQESIIVGHGRDYDSYRNDLTDDMPEPPENLPIGEYEKWYDEVTSQYSDDYPTSQAKDAAASAIAVMRKNVSQIIAENQCFFQSLDEVKQIHIYGFSFAEIDLPYLFEITKKVDIQNVHLELSYYSDEDKKKAEKFIKRILPPKSVSFIKLEDIMKYKQLSLFESPDITL